MQDWENAEGMLRQFERAGSYEKFQEKYEKFCRVALAEKSKYRDFAKKISTAEKYPEKWKQAFQSGLELIDFFPISEDVERLIERIIDILGENIELFYTEKDGGKERFIILDVCIDIVEIMYTDDRIHIPAAMYDILKNENYKNMECEEFYGSLAEQRILERTYTYIVQAEEADKWIRSNASDREYRKEFVGQLQKLRSEDPRQRGENDTQKKKINKPAVILSFLLVIAAVMAFSMALEESSSREQLAEVQSQYEKQKTLYEEMKKIKEGQSGKEEQLQKENEGLKKENDTLKKENDILKGENDALKKEAGENAAPVKSSGETETAGTGEGGLILNLKKDVGVYDQPDDVSRPAGEILPSGTEVTVLEIMGNNKWFKIKYGEKEGHIRVTDIYEDEVPGGAEAEEG